MKKAGFFALSVILICVLLESGLRLVLMLSAGAPFFHPSDVIYTYYPELLPISRAHISNTDSTFDILILSCSVLHKDWVDITTELNRCLKTPVGYNSIKIYNASGVGHGSRDNLIKCGLLKDKKFDAVIYYDAINDSRLNNCPPEIFKKDYSHYQWYDEINTIVKHPEINFTVIPFFIDWLKIRLKAISNKNAYIPRHFSMRPEWLIYGDNFKSLPCYTANVKKVAETMHQRGAGFYYFTFAYYLPGDYSLSKFQDKSLDYSFCNHSRETEIWGVPQNVAGFIDSVNHCSKPIITQIPGACWIDLYNQFPKSGPYFADICHFSPKGIQAFAGIVCYQLDSLINTQLSARRGGKQ